jgi:hypothetical protein
LLKKFFVYNFPVKNAPDLSEIGSVSQEIYLSAIDLAHVLKVTDAEIAKLARSAVLVRFPIRRTAVLSFIRCWRT